MSGRLLEVVISKDILLPNQYIRISHSDSTRRHHLSQSHLKLKLKVTRNNGKREDLPLNTKFKVTKRVFFFK